MTTNTDPGIDNILRNVQVVAASEGGSIEFIEATGGKLVVEYTPGQKINAGASFFFDSMCRQSSRRTGLMLRNPGAANVSKDSELGISQ